MHGRIAIKARAQHADRLRRVCHNCSMYGALRLCGSSPLTVAACCWSSLAGHGYERLRSSVSRPAAHCSLAGTTRLISRIEDIQRSKGEGARGGVPSGRHSSRRPLFAGHLALVFPAKAERERPSTLLLRVRPKQQPSAHRHRVCYCYVAHTTWRNLDVSGMLSAECITSCFVGEGYI